MKINVELQSYLEEYSPSCARSFTLEIHDAATVADALGKLQIPADLASVVILDGSAVTPQDPLKDGANLTVAPPIAGGSGAATCK